MKQGDLVRLYPSKRLVVIFNVTKQDLISGMNTYKTGLHGFYGCWYEGKNPTNRESMGKIECEPVGRVVGRVTNNRYLAKLLG